MRNRFVIAAASLVVGSLLATSVPAAATDGNPQPPSFGFGVVRMDGRQEISSTGQPGAGDVDGRGKFIYVAFGDQLCYLLTVKRIDTPVAAHIHQAPAGVNGSIQVFLTTPTNGFSFDCIEAVPDTTPNTPMIMTQSELNAIIATPEAFYANVHTMAFPAGAVRGQLA